jgi:hypothetical protein
MIDLVALVADTDAEWTFRALLIYLENWQSGSV